MIASRNLVLGLGLVLAACGPQPQSIAASNDTAEVAATPASVAVTAEPTASPAASNGQDYTIDRTNQTGTDVIREILVRAGTFDGERITGFALQGRCQTVFTTAAGTTTIDWSKVGNWAGRSEGDRFVLPIDDGTGTHLIGMPERIQPEPIGNARARVEGGFGVMADNCQS